MCVDVCYSRVEVHVYECRCVHVSCSHVGVITNCRYVFVTGKSLVGVLTVQLSMCSCLLVECYVYTTFDVCLCPFFHVLMLLQYSCS